MTDPLFPSDHLFDPTLGFKLEPGMDAMVTSASVPIPSRRLQEADYPFELNADPFNISSPLVSNDNTLDMTFASDLNSWSRDMKVDAFQMDDEDIFQVEKSDLIQGPTLAELNASEDQLLTGDLTFDGLLLPGDHSGFHIPAVTMLHVDTPQSALSPPSTGSPSPLQSQSHLGVNSSFVPSSFPPAGLGLLKDSGVSSSVPLTCMDMYLPQPVAALSPTSQHSGNSPSPRHSTLHELLIKREPIGRSIPAASPPHRPMARPRPSSRLSSSAPTNLGMDQIWQRREPRQHLLSTGSLAEADSVSSISTLGILSPESHEFSLDDGSDSEDESDRLELDEASSDKDSSDEEGGKSQPSSAKRERFFWQYNVQAKGPKGQRLVLKTKLEDPHFLNEVTDPVFSPGCSVRGIKHSGKARKGDGNDLTPNPKKLQSIGRELEKLNKVINDITPVSELPFNVRPKTRKEKNKLASRACRLKKKAQHEANKIKLFGLEHEHKRLMAGIQQMKQIIVAKVTADPSAQEELTKQGDKVFKAASKVRIAGHSTDYVNRVLERSKNGVPDGGLTEY